MLKFENKHVITCLMQDEQGHWKKMEWQDFFFWESVTDVRVKQKAVTGFSLGFQLPTPSKDFYANLINL